LLVGPKPKPWNGSGVPVKRRVREVSELTLLFILRYYKLFWKKLLTLPW
jgi:hypothetical protein